MAKDGKKYRDESIDLAAQMAASGEVVDRYGSAVKEHFVGYSGRDNEFDRTLKRGLKKTAQSKVNPEYREQNLRQQSGYSAEDKYTARKNSEEIITGSKKRYTRTDDIGRVNDPLFDHIVIDENGVEIIGSGEQMKFVGSSAKECLSKLKSDKYQKYIDADAKLTVPSDYYYAMLSEADSEIQSLQRQLDTAKRNGNSQLAKQIEGKIKKLQKIKKNLNNSGISNKEALEARLNPKYSTAKDVVKLSHRAGIEQLKTGAAVSGGLSLIRNVVKVCKGEKSAGDAAAAFAKDTATGAAVSYTTAFAGSVIKGSMQNARSNTIRALAKTNAPGMIVTATFDLGKTMCRFFNGEIDGVECLQEIGEKGTSSIGAAMFAAAGQAIIPIPVVGAVVGSMIGYTLTASFYGQLVNALKEQKLSYQRRIEAERQCEEALKMISEYRREMNTMLSKYFGDMKAMMASSFSLMEKAFQMGDIDMYISGANVITHSLRSSPTYKSFDEFDNFMNSSNSLIL